MALLLALTISGFCISRRREVVIGREGVDGAERRSPLLGETIQIHLESLSRVRRVRSRGAGTLACLAFDLAPLMRSGVAIRFAVAAMPPATEEPSDATLNPSDPGYGAQCVANGAEVGLDVLGTRFEAGREVFGVIVCGRSTFNRLGKKWMRRRQQVEQRLGLSGRLTGERFGGSRT